MNNMEEDETTGLVADLENAARHAGNMARLCTLLLIALFIGWGFFLWWLW